MTLLSTEHNYQKFKTRLHELEQRFGREKDSVQLIAVSKKQTIQTIQTLAQAGQQIFAENYLQEALLKMTALTSFALEWHFIGRIQYNKIRSIGEHFSWVQSLCDLKTAVKLNNYRGKIGKKPIQVCLQINLDQESTKSGLATEEVIHLAQQLRTLPYLCLRGIMVLPKITLDFAEQRQSFKRARWLFETLKQAGFEVDTLSMGTSHDFVAAIAEGATHIRVGEALFGPRGEGKNH